MNPNRALPELRLARNYFQKKSETPDPRMMKKKTKGRRMGTLPELPNRSQSTEPAEDHRLLAAQRDFGMNMDDLLLDTNHGPSLAMDIVRYIASDIQSMERIKASFKRITDRENKEGVDLDEFVEVLKNNLPVQLRESVDMIANLCELFSEIDVNGDDEVAWEEFTTFVVDSGMVAKDQHIVDSIKPYHQRKVPSGFSSGFCQVEKVKYLEGIDKLAVFERDSRIVKIHMPDTGVLHKSLRAHKGAVVATEFIPDHCLLASCAMDDTVALWDTKNQYALRRHALVHCGTQTSMMWEPTSKLLFTGSMKGPLHAFSVGETLEAMANTPMVPVMTTAMREGHMDMVMDITPIPRLACIASASLDATIRIWDPVTCVRRKTLKGHKKGVLSVAYLDEFRVLASAGFDHDALIWNPFVESSIFRLSGHLHPLTNVCAVPGTPQLITSDSNRNVKVWDVRTFKCVQTLVQADDDWATFPLTSMTYNSRSHNIVTSSRSLKYFTYGETKRSDTTEDSPVVAVLYNESAMSVITVAGSTMKIWDAQTGALERAFRDITSYDITAVALDPKHRKIVVADSSGQIQVRHASNGLLLRTLASHREEVTCVTYCASKAAIASSSTSGAIYVHDDANRSGPGNNNASNEGGLNQGDIVLQDRGGGRDGAGAAADVGCVAFSDVFSILLSGSRDSTISIWSFDNSQPLASLEGHEGEVTAAIFLGTFPAVVSADSAGTLRLWPVGPVAHKYRNRCLVEWSNGGGAVLSLAFDAEELSLYTGDEEGGVRAWGMTSLLEEGVPWLLSPDHSHLYGGGAAAGAAGAGGVDLITRKSDAAGGGGVPRPDRVGGRGSGGGGEGAVAAGEIWGVGGNWGDEPSPPSMSQKWKAHTDSVSSLCLVAESDVILTGSFDQRVCLWDKHTGLMMGKLEDKQKSVAPDMWNFPKSKVSRTRTDAYERAERIVREARMGRAPRKGASGIRLNRRGSKKVGGPSAQNSSHGLLNLTQNIQSGVNPGDNDIRAMMGLTRQTSTTGGQGMGISPAVKLRKQLSRQNSAIHLASKRASGGVQRREGSSGMLLPPLPGGGALSVSLPLLEKENGPPTKMRQA